ncbi:hypothetical protein CC665_001446 [Salmonella enterica subsp. diarizonae]|nr:hypothetical protein [Salmonella enterica]ECL4299343.1 hypothetical protein [Salmonella enterica]EDF7600454.1 hypothetical protein [Salmonella enterica]EDX4762304.1 hypothetical protein [Salmonella enterica]EEJ3597402.1 hypothetical protein [Salmonella enterica subsp. diarizonae]
MGSPCSDCAEVWGNPERANRLFCIWGWEVLAECGTALMPLASLYCLLPIAYCLLISGELIGVYVIPLASKRILLFISTQRTHKSVFCVEINKFPYLSLLA